MSELIRLCIWCPPGDARPATSVCPRCARPMCDLHRVRESSPPSRCDACEAEFRDLLNSGKQIGITAAWTAGPIVAGTALIVTGQIATGAAVLMIGPLAGIALRVYQRRRGRLRRRFLAERADVLPAARVVQRLPPG